MRILIHDTLVTAPFVVPIQQGWTETPVEIELQTTIHGGDLGADQIALIPSSDVAWIQETHQVIPDVAVVSSTIGAIAMRVPVRPDEVTATPVRLYETSSLAEILGRATLHPFYGIFATSYTTDDIADAQVVIVEGAAALQAPEAGFREDLVRAWFILTGQPVVSHVLVAPKDRDRDALAPVLNTFETLRSVSHERRRDLRKIVAERDALDRDTVMNLFADQRLTLELEDRRALLMLLQHGNRGSSHPYVWNLSYLEPVASEEAAPQP